MEFLRGDQHGPMERGHHLKNLVQKKENSTNFMSVLEVEEIIRYD